MEVDAIDSAVSGGEKWAVSTSPVVVGEYTVYIDAGYGSGSGSTRAVNGDGRQFSCRIHSQQVHDSLLEARSRLSNSRYVSHLRSARVSANRLYAFYEPAYGDLHTYVRERGWLDECLAASYFRQIVQCVYDAHQAGVVLRDLRLRNIVFSDSYRTQLMVESLAESVCLQDAVCDLVCISHQTCPTYMSPEMLDAAKSGSKYSGRASDCWFLGVILYTLLSGQYPFCDKDLAVLFQRIKNAYFCPPPSHVSSTARSLIRALLRRDPSERLTVAQVLQHPWLTQNGYADNSNHDHVHFVMAPRRFSNRTEVGQLPSLNHSLGGTSPRRENATHADLVCDTEGNFPCNSNTLDAASRSTQSHDAQ